MADVTREAAAVTATVDTIERRPCDVEGCARFAVEAMRFRHQPGHVHVCGPCGAMDREWCDVVEAVLLPCPWAHNGEIWTAKPRELS